jgi:hypothetical protein
MNELSQISIVVNNLNEKIENFWKMLGVGPWKVYMFAPPRLTNTYFKGKPTEFKMKLALANVGRVMLELVEPLGGENVFSEFLRNKGEGVHHIACFRFDSLDEFQIAITELEKLGSLVLLEGQFEHTKFCYLDTYKALGVVCEITYAPPPEPRPDYIYPLL